MAFVIEPFENIEIQIPGKKGIVVLTVPPLDCFTPDQVEKMNAEIANTPEGTPLHLDPNKNATALGKAMLCFFNPTESEAIHALVPRYVMAIDKYWSDASGVSLGKSEPSTDIASEETAQA